MSLSHYCLRIESVQPRISPEVAVTSITRYNFAFRLIPRWTCL
ncbi:unnamed protein product [Brassica rapa subsp. trilocularis]